MASASLRLSVAKPRATLRRTNTVRVAAAAWTSVALTKDALSAAGTTVIEVGGQKILFAAVDGEVFAVSNKCTHLGLPLVGKTSFFQGQIKDSCIVCPAHATAFDLATGEVKGTWCPKFPDLPFVGKGSKAAPLPTFQSRVDESGNIEVLV